MAGWKVVSAAVLFGVSGLAVGSTASAQEPVARARTPRVERHYYDTDRRDYHEWNTNEDRHYRDYLSERRRKYRDFSRLSKQDQRAYWQWRHEHGDRPDERR